MKYLHDNRIVYRRYSPDQATQEFDWGWYYAEGTHGYYSLFRSNAKINTYKSLKWHLLTNRLRKVVFKDGTGLDTSEKLSIVGSIVGRKRIKKEDIYDAMLHINEQGESITISKLAKALKCTPRTIHRNMGEELKKEKDKLNIDNEKI